MLKMEYYRLALIASAKSGIPADWIYSQWAHETADFTSELCLSYNNFGGVTQVEDNGLSQPDGAYYYMRFDTPVLFAEYFGDYLNLYHDDGIHSALSLYDYVMALHAGGYFGDDPDNYYYGCNRFYEEVIKNG